MRYHFIVDSYQRILVGVIEVFVNFDGFDHDFIFRLCSVLSNANLSVSANRAIVTFNALFAGERVHGT